MKESDKSHNTKKSYQTAINKLIEFEKTFNTKLRFIDINMDFYNKFNNWMLNSTYTNGKDPFLH
ncbi:MAG: phage integrase SAM-like domain-containing protein [Prevotellaceae bacterium]|jgi:hypothetical protein|nr:phage integrase SAM-like domain-containing protein [Prevotellaceae bacterium]